MDERKTYLFRCLREESGYKHLNDTQLEQALERCMAADDAFMDQSGVAEGQMYDDDAAHAFICAELTRAVPQSRPWADALVDDYLAYNETYLEDHGEIAWDE